MDHNNIKIISRIGIFGTFFGHGLVALSANPKWIPLLTCYGFSENEAVTIMPFIGIVDIAVAFMILFYPLRGILLWAAFWAFMTAVSRPISGDSPIEFIERSANWTLPLMLLMLQGFPLTVKSLFTITDKVKKKNRPRVRTV